MFTVWLTVYMPALPLYVTVGAVLSMLTERAALAVFPALSVQPTVATCPAPSSVRVAEVHVSTPDSASVPLAVTLTLALFQPLALAAGDWLVVTTGAVRSILIPLTVEVVLLPALSDTLVLA